MIYLIHATPVIKHTAVKSYLFCSFFLFLNWSIAFELESMASSSSSHQQNQRLNAFSEIEPASKRRRVSESSRVYEVFINHRGPDVKETLATQLYNSLQQLGIEAFLDSQEKELGTSFPSTIETAIRSAKVHIAIFSPRYAESAWCLNELLLMLESTAKIIPVFYQVKPSDLRRIESGIFAGAFINYQEKGRYLEKLEGWKEALRSLSLIAGEEFNSSSNGDYQKIVASVQKEVQRKTCLHVAEYPVGLNNLVEDFEKRCLDDLVEDFESHCRQEEGKHKAQIVGIFGMGGAGKTTLAKELFNRNKKYTRTSFLFDVREKSVTSQLPSLQGKLIKDLFGKEINFTSTEEGTADLKDRLGRSPPLSVLIVVDDIDHVEQLNALAVMDIFKNSANSLIIVTTRDFGVLLTAGITTGYNLKGMDRNCARELFCWHAFRQAHPVAGYESLVDSFADVCGGLPLSLQVLGRHVHGRPVTYWSSELIKVSKTLPRDVQKKLLISFEALDDEEKQVFMDTACFFVGKPKIIAERVWERSGWDAQHALQTLKDKCLVEEIVNLSLTLTIEEGNVLRMHDHLRDLGREMAAELSHPQRLWRPQHLKCVEAEGFKNMPTKTNLRCFHSFSEESMGFRVTFFLGHSDSCLETSESLIWLPHERHSKEQPSIPSRPILLRNLHYLKIHLGQRKTSWEKRIQAPSQLKDLQISQTSSKEFPVFLGISDNLENVLLDARESPIQGLSLLESLSMNISSLCLSFSTLKGEQASIKRGDRTLYESLVILNFKFDGESHWDSGKGPVRSLEKLEINGEEFVSKILISGIHYPRLESIKLHHMENLVELDITRVKTLNFLDIRNCPKLKRLTGISDLPNLVLVNISQCSQLKQLSLERIPIVDCKHSTSKSGIPDLRNLEGSEVKNCTDLVAVDHFYSVPGESSFRMLAQLNISECQELEELRLGHLSCLEKITIENCNHLKYLCVRGIKCLESITVDEKLMVKYFDLDDCQNLKILQLSFKELVELSIRGCPELITLPAFQSLNCLERIEIDGYGKSESLQLYHCGNLKSVSCNSIRWLSITNCSELEEFSDLSRMSSFEKINITLCEKIQNIRLPTTLIRLSLESCRDLRTVAGTGDLLELQELTITECPELEELPDLSRMSSLEEIVIFQCEKIQNIRLPTTLIRLSLKSCRELRTVAGTGSLLELNLLTITECPNLEELPDLSRTSCVEEIVISQCEKIQNIRLPTKIISLTVESCRELRTVAGTGSLLELNKLTIKKCPNFEELPDRTSCVEEIKISQCEKIQIIRLPTKIIRLTVESCRELRTVAGTGDLLELQELTIRDCPELEELPDLSRMSSLKVGIYPCEKIQNIRLPTKIICLTVESCRELRTVAGTGDLLELQELTIRDCPELEELPDLSRMSSLKVGIYQCEKIQNIRLPTKIICLTVESCRELRTVAGTGDLLELEELTIRDCPELEELPDLSRARCMWSIVTDSCEKLQSIEVIEELEALTFMKLVYCSNTLIRNSIHKLKSRPDEMVMIGRAADGAESNLNENLFQDANIYVDGVGEIGPHTIYPMWLQRNAVIACFVVDVDSCTWVRDINESIQAIKSFPLSEFSFEVRQGEWVVTLVDCIFWKLSFIVKVSDVLKRHGILKKGIWVGLKKAGTGKIVQVLSPIVDRLYHS